jgi:glycosyltransferase involved in cell wall biosynthesis
VDGPDPATVETLMAFGDPRIQIIELPENVGGSEARNIGARYAKGEWIALLDDDDEWLPTKVEEQISQTLALGHANPFVSSFYYLRSSGKADVVKPRRLPYPDEDTAGYIFEPHCALNTSTYLCRRDLFLAVPFEKGLPCLQDFDWYLRVMNRPDVTLVVIPNVLSIYNDPSGRATVTGKVKWQFALHFANSRRSLMSRRTYARFIVKCCVRLAVRQKAGFKGVFKLFTEMFRNGAPNFQTVSMFMLFCLTK